MTYLTQISTGAQRRLGEVKYDLPDPDIHLFTKRRLREV